MGKIRWCLLLLFLQITSLEPNWIPYGRHNALPAVRLTEKSCRNLPTNWWGREVFTSWRCCLSPERWVFIYLQAYHCGKRTARAKHQLYTSRVWFFPAMRIHEIIQVSVLCLVYQIKNFHSQFKPRKSYLILWNQMIHFKEVHLVRHLHFMSFT